MTRPRAPLAFILPALAVVGGVAWAQDGDPIASAGLGELGTGAGGGLLIVVADRIIGAWKQSKADERNEKAQAARDAERAALGADLLRLRDLHNALSERTGRLDERMTSHARQAEQQHADLMRMVQTLDDIRDRLPPKP
jgi:hypothetical protein